MPMKTDSIQLLYDKIRFEYHDAKHKYLVSKLIKDGLFTEPIPVTGITTIIDIISKGSLVQWSANMATEYVKDNFNGENLNAVLVEAKVAYKNKSLRASTVGSMGHKLIEALLLGKDIKFPDNKEMTEQLENIAIQHAQFEDAFKPKTIHLEQPMYSLLHNFAGTDDRFCVINNRKVVIDYKTSNRSYYNPDGIYASNFAQLGGQIILIEEQFEETVDDAWIVNFAKDSTEYKFKRLSDTGLTTLDAKLYFLSCLNLYEMNKLWEFKFK